MGLWLLGKEGVKGDFDLKGFFVFIKRIMGMNGCEGSSNGRSSMEDTWFWLQQVGRCDGKGKKKGIRSEEKERRKGPLGFQVK